MTNRDAGGSFRVLQFFKCLVEGHDFRTSRTFNGMKTCIRCKLRKPGGT